MDDTQQPISPQPQVTQNQQAAWVPVQPNPGQPPTPTSVPKKGMAWWGWVLIGCGSLFFLIPVLIVLVLVALNPAERIRQAQERAARTATSSATISAAKSETEGWKTYTNSSYGFSLSYPVDWEITEQSVTNSTSVIAYFGIRPKSLKEDNAQGITIFTTSLKDTKDYYTKIIFANSILLGETTTSIGGLKATKLSFKNKTDSSVTPTVNLVEKGDYIFSISGCCSGPTSEVEQLTEKIITTFKFL